MKYWTYEFNAELKTIEDAPASGGPPNPRKRFLVQALMRKRSFNYSQANSSRGRCFTYNCNKYFNQKIRLQLSPS